MKPALVIVGPIISNGICGQHAHIDKSNFPKELITEFNCNENIKQIRDSFSENVSKIYLYSGDCTSQINGIHHLNFIDYNDNLKHDHGSNPHLKINNSKRFINNIVNALDQVKEDKIIIQRTDQYIPINLFTNDYFKYNEIFIPRIKKNYLEVSDFYFSGYRSTLNKRFKEILKSELSGDNIHRFFWKSKSKSYISRASKNLKHPYNIFNFQKFEAKKLQHDLRALPFSIYSKTYWRGSLFSEEHLESIRDSYLFKENFSHSLSISFKEIIKDFHLVLRGLFQLINK